MTTLLGPFRAKIAVIPVLGTNRSKSAVRTLSRRWDCSPKRGLAAVPSFLLPYSPPLPVPLPVPLPLLLETLRRAFEDFRRLYGVGAILDPDDPQCCADEKANITYLAEVMKAMPELDEGEEGGEGGRTGARLGRRLKGGAAVEDTQQVSLLSA